MIVIPAIDLKQGKCVRLLQGKASEETVYSDDPVAMALSFEEQGAQRLHLVDLDGAFHGNSQNLEQIKAIAQAIHTPIELGGGIRSIEDIQKVLDLGIQSAIIGTMALKDPSSFEKALSLFQGEQLILGIDAKNGKVAVEGWEEESSTDAIEFGKHWKSLGVQRVIFTDISRDGMLTGPNLEALTAFATQTSLKVTASGGVSSKEDIESLKELEAIGVDHVIVGKAIYEGRVQLNEVV